MRGWPGAERAKWGREESLYWIDEQIRSIELKALQIGAHRCRNLHDNGDKRRGLDEIWNRPSHCDGVGSRYDNYFTEFRVTADRWLTAIRSIRERHIEFCRDLVCH